MKKTILLASGLLLFFAAVNYTSAQTSSRDNPIPINASEISGSFIDHQEDNNKEDFYSFTAGPGELTIVFDVKRRGRDGGASIAFELLERDGSTSILCCEGAQSGDGGTGRRTVSVKIPRRQTVILHLTNASIGGGSFNVRLSGAGISGDPTSGGGYGGRNDTGNDGYRDDRGGRDNGGNLNVPATGILHIRMKNGTTRDIDLSLIRNISIRS